jgi:DNA repair protein RadC
VVFSSALKCLASSIVLAHNHPSGQLRPSEEDIRLTRKLIEGARYLDLSIYDHVILSREGFYSFMDSGMM